MEVIGYSLIAVNLVLTFILSMAIKEERKMRLFWAEQADKYKKATDHYYSFCEMKVKQEFEAKQKE